MSEFLNVTYPLMEHFYTLQGEGRNAGQATYFLRFGGCDVGCVWCDVKESWNADNHPHISVSEMLQYIIKSKANKVVITGGEPAMYDLTPITTVLKTNKIDTYIETSGTYEVKGSFDWICFSPKKFKQPVESIYTIAHELKVIVYHKSDLAWALEHASKTNPECKLYLQPEWSKKDEMLPIMIDFIKENTNWALSLQTHKYIDIP